MSDVRLFTAFRVDTLVPYFWAMDQSDSPDSTLCVAASTSSAAKIADAIAAVAVTDMNIFFLDNVKSPFNVVKLLYKTIKFTCYVFY